MDSIRLVGNRPTIALVLSGGGAKGSAHVGVKKLMDEMEIPIDLICGTSMGGLMGGLMSMGYSCEYIDSLLRHQNWDITLSDKVHPKFIPYETKDYKTRYLLSIPFHYKPESIDERIREQEKYSPHNGALRLGAHQGDLNTRKGLSALSSSLPSGYVYGFNVSNLLSSFSVGYQDSIAFKDLPIPFFCVATDLVSCKAKNWGSGSVKTAMRSTMSIPALFDPVRTHGMILVDGGTRNNFPVDLARALGADIVVGVDLSDARPSYSEVNNIGDIVSQFISMLGKDAFDKNVPGCDIFIKPDLEGYHMLSFNPAAIDTMINRGYKAAALKTQEFIMLKELVGDAKPYLSAEPATDINHRAVRVRSILFEGVSDRESKMLQEKIQFSAGQLVTAGIISDAMSKIQSTGCFESVTYSLFGKDEPYDLVFSCIAGPTHQLGLGVRADSEEWVALLLNLGLNTHQLMGSKFDFELKVGIQQRIVARYTLDLPRIPTVNFDVTGSHVYAEMRDLSSNKYDMSFLHHMERLYFSNMKWTRLNLKAGIKNQYYNMPITWKDSDGTQMPERKSVESYGSLFVHGEIVTLESKYYPRHGFNLWFDYDASVAKSHVPGFKPTHALAFNWQHVFPAGRKFAIIPDFHWRSLIDNNGSGIENSQSMSNYVGGSIFGRYFYHQIPMVGVLGIFNALDHAAVINLTLRYNPYKDLFISAKGGYFRDETTFSDMVSSLKPTFTGLAAEVGYNTILGPVKAEVIWSGLTSSVGYYLSFGYDF